LLRLLNRNLLKFDKYIYLAQYKHRHTERKIHHLYSLVLVMYLSVMYEITNKNLKHKTPQFLITNQNKNFRIHSYISKKLIKFQWMWVIVNYNIIQYFSIIFCN
jgi:hypothetical protein